MCDRRGRSGGQRATGRRTGNCLPHGSLEDGTGVLLRWVLEVVEAWPHFVQLLLVSGQEKTSRPTNTKPYT